MMLGIFHRNLFISYYNKGKYNAHFRDEETEAQKIKATFQKDPEPHWLTFVC